MPTDLLTMHKAFLEDIADRRQRLQRELTELEPVEEYHRRAIEQLDPKYPRYASGKVLPLGITDKRLLNASRHEACEIALRELGGQAKTQEIANWLLERNYGKEFDSTRIFHNTCYTALSRKTDIFEKVGPGEWKLVA